MKLTVVIVNYNVEHFLEQCLISAQKSLQQVDGEIFVVDNNSIDGSVEMVKRRFPDVKLIENKENTGFSKANNQAIRLAQGEYVLLLNPDTVVEEDTFIKCVDFMDEHKDAGGLGVKMIDGKGEFLPESKRGLPTPAVAFYKIFGLSTLFPKSKRFGKYHLGFLDKDETHEIEILSGAFMLMRNDALKKVGLLDEDFFMYGEDIDLSYRIIKGGYKNYYLPETSIIHYKGESTKKSSVNYVFVFYNAMVIFAKKHFSEKNAKSFSFLINLAIYLRAGAAVLSRFIKKAIVPFIDFALIATTLFFLIKGYEIYSDKIYQWDILKWAIPGYSFLWSFGVFAFGGFDRPLKFFNIVKGVAFGTLAILVIYALLPKSLQFSRLAILLGAASSLALFGLTRGLYTAFNLENFSLKKSANTRFAIVGTAEESERVLNLLRQITSNIQEISFVYPDSETKKAGFTGNLSQLNQIIHINKIDEIIFCAKDISSRMIIELMSTLEVKNMEYKIAQPESLYLIGSNSIDTSGDLYMIEVNSITLPKNVRAKRFFDISASIVMLSLLPIVVWFPKKKIGFISNVFLVLIGKKTWVGFSPSSTDEKLSLPKIKKGVLSPISLFSTEVTAEKATKLNLIYAKDYKAAADLKILSKSLKNAGS